MIEKILQDLGFGEREARLYLAGLETGLAPASKIAKQAGEKRVTAHQVLQGMQQKGRSREIKKNNISHYDMLSPNELVSAYDDKVSTLRDRVPDMVGMMNQYASKPKVQYYEGREQLKDLFLSITDSGTSKKDTYLTFLGAINVDEQFAVWLETEFVPYRLQSPAVSKSLIAAGDHSYLDYTMSHHQYRMVPDPVFELANEIVIYDQNKVALLMYNQDELSGVVIQSLSFHQALTSIFQTIRNSLE